MLSQKSMAVHSRKSYGKEGLDYKLFTSRPFKSYKNILLRSGGNDTYEGIIRDPMVTGLAHNADIEVQAWRPCLLLVNGENLGLYHMREKVNEHYLANHYDLNPNHVHIMFKHNEVRAGSDSQYVAMIDYAKKNDLKSSAHYEWMKEQMDVANYAAYQVVEIYAANADWPGNNIKYWRHRAEGNKWRWILYDTDQTFDIWEGKAPAHINTLNHALTGTSDNSPSRLLLNALIANQEFVNLFVVTLTDFLNTHLKTSVVKKHIDSLRNDIDPFLSYQWSSKYSMHDEHYGLDANISKMKRFAEDRPDNVLGHFRSKFGLGSMVELGIKTEGTGSVKLTSHAFVKGNWSGDYFQNVPVVLTATPVDGHPFEGWSGGISSKDLSITLPMHSATSVTAKFGNDPNYKAPKAPPVVKIPVPVKSGIKLRTGLQLQLVQNQLAVDLPQTGNFSLTLLNLKGKVISHQNLHGHAGVNMIPLNAENGMIIARVRQGTQMRSIMLPKVFH